MDDNPYRSPECRGARGAPVGIFKPIRMLACGILTSCGLLSWVATVGSTVFLFFAPARGVLYVAVCGGITIACIFAVRRLSF